ncbi:ferrochelatase [Arenibacter algicola]|jgi:ferrochelatase|uniref:Ferrochelatase n=1 Tax=Arenibacter algicola TaxID=616991 RepID=A0ABY3AE64_9FLAO|nr:MULTISPECIES: ferrochelatase [Arenibacter]MDX1759834.1 ferrochelatase [Arenibacter algicola]GBF18380.1 ferrochelatase [Arenibacter sp. NBRC 103722]|tara:strand:- start:35664 stop:36695 length:1032 start_codon:yes stop_codon:yes gene_type:complete|eukprot:TRINITY_DN10227_c0_g1_i1.p1 TRINITY_DN10227_c0_g1~~TRINITY_DN10227_c0_g1_i1.p1  ORF type:complete len:344 (-),score=56.21 TRINITY_DN10227_c0_g1_i1:2005-3036(-)
MKGVLLVNLGSPDSPTPKDVKPYLDEFLMDERVIDVPNWLRNIIVRGIILQTRPKKSAEAYQKIWWEEGSPLIVISERFADKVKEQSEIPVALGMRYGSMTIKNALGELSEKGVDEVLLVPLYPHYAMSSYETVVVKTMEVKDEFFPKIKITTLPAFYNNKDYIEVLSESIAAGLKGFEYDHILFSYHGIPERHIRKSDPTKFHCKIDESCCKTNSVAHHTCYRHQCYEMTEKVKEYLGLSNDKVSLSFQSRLPNDPWLKPYTDFEFERFGKEGIKRLAVITPAFVADCLETLEEIAMEGKHQFQEAGGEDYKHIPCLNDNEEWVNLMVKWIGDWQTKETLPV